MDLKNTYFMIPIHEEDRDFLKFQFRDKYYMFNCLLHLGSSEASSSSAQRAGSEADCLY